jgi:hypothetical protein
VAVCPEYYAARTVAFFDEYLARPVDVSPEPTAPDADEDLVLTAPAGETARASSAEGASRPPRAPVNPSAARSAVR